MNSNLLRGARFTFEAALCAIALVFCYARAVRGLFEQWSTDEDMLQRVALPATAAPRAIFANARVAGASWLPRLDSATPRTLAGAAIFFLFLSCLGAARELHNAIYEHYHA
jgi:hypothetical protein